MKETRIGETKVNNFGTQMVIVDYRNNNDMDVYFPEYDWIAEGVAYCAFKKGEIRCAYEKRTFGIGCLGTGAYKATENGKQTKCYKTWNHMFERCYSPKVHERKPTYIGCEVAEEWHNFQNFAKWYEENYYQVGSEVMALDKDIICKHNKVYSPQNCVFVPQSINSLFVKRNASRGDLPIGVHFNKNANKYIAQCSINGKLTHLGSFDTQEQAFQAYKQAKEEEIKEIANEYKDRIPDVLYQAMMNYEVSILD